jgi:hypothetical protein
LLSGSRVRQDTSFFPGVELVLVRPHTVLVCRRCRVGGGLARARADVCVA